jgi:hypothetical protein
VEQDAQAEQAVRRTTLRMTTVRRQRRRMQDMGKLAAGHLHVS